MEKCIGCELCAAVCPADCIYVRGADNPEDAPVSPGERYGFVYEINYLRCIHCDLCVEACPTEAITESKLFEFSFTSRADAIYTKAELVVDDDGQARSTCPGRTGARARTAHTSGWMRATSPSGAAAYEGEVQWSGELGYGVRAARGRPERQARRRGDRQHLDPHGRAQQDPGPLRREGPLMWRRLLAAATHSRRDHLRHRGGDRASSARSAWCSMRNPVHSALMLVMTLFGVAVLFVEENAQFLAAVQVIVYAGAIVVLFLFVIMLLGVDRRGAGARRHLPRPAPRRDRARRCSCSSR